VRSGLLRPLCLVALAALPWVGSGCVTPAPPFPEVPAWGDPRNQSTELGEKESALWERSAETISEIEEDELVRDDALDAYLAEIVEDLWPELPPPAPRIRILVVAEADRNAYAWPNGVLLISSGLLVTLENEAQLAYLIGHEIAHVLERHSLEEVRYEAITGSHVDRMKLSKQSESEADRIGYEIFIEAGYAPLEALRMMRHLEDPSEPPLDRIRSWESHADVSARIVDLRRMVPKEPVADTKIESERFLAVVDGLRLGVVELEIDAREYESARARVFGHLQREPGSSHAYYLRAEITRRMSGEGKRDRAVRLDYERALELDPENPDALRALGLLLRGTAAQEESAALLARYLEARPDAIDHKMIARYLGRVESEGGGESASASLGEESGSDSATTESEPNPPSGP
jgi:predicted Zn-dependent protease